MQTENQISAAPPGRTEARSPGLPDCKAKGPAVMERVVRRSHVPTYTPCRAQVSSSVNRRFYVNTNTETEDRGRAFPPLHLPRFCVKGRCKSQPLPLAFSAFTEAARGSQGPGKLRSPSCLSPGSGDRKHSIRPGKGSAKRHLWGRKFNSSSLPVIQGLSRKYPVIY